MNFKKTFLAITLAGFIFTSCKQNTTEATTETVASPATETETETENLAATGKIETASFTIDGMSCEIMCASKIQKELTKTDGVQKATIDFEKKTATVEYDAGKISPEKLVETVEAVNGGESYKVSNLKSSADQASYFPNEKEKKKKKSKKEKKAEAEKTDKPACCKSKKSCSSSESQKENTL